MKILVLGELNPDLILQGYQTFPTLGREVLVDDVQLTLGSSSAICAHGLARLGNEVSFLGKVGQDEWGDYCVGFLEKAGIDTSLIIRDRHVKTGITVSITGREDRALVTYAGAIAALRAEEVEMERLHGFHHLHVSSYYLQQALQPGLPRLFEQAQSIGLTTSLDPGGDPAHAYERRILNALPYANVFLPSETELAGLTGESDPLRALQFLQGKAALTVAKLGSQGALTIQNGEPLSMPALPVNPVDTTGAGDSFDAGFIHAWVRGEPLEASLRFAAACGALSTLGLGGCGAQPTEDEARVFIAQSMVMGGTR